MHYRVGSAALLRSRVFKDREKAFAFAEALAKQTIHEVRIRIVGGSYSYDQMVMYVFNRKTPSGSE